MSQTPAIGCIVHYTFSKADRGEIDAGHQVEEIGTSHTVPAMIVYVWSETCVNLQVFPDGPCIPIWETYVERKDAVDPQAPHPEVAPYWEWPPRS